MGLFFEDIFKIIVLPILGFLILSLYIKPYVKLWTIIRKVDKYLTNYGYIIANPPGRIERDPQRSQVDRILRNQAAEFHSFSRTLNPKVLKFFKLPSKKDLSFVHSQLIFLSNSLYRGDGAENAGKVRIIEERLGLRKV